MPYKPRDGRPAVPDAPPLPKKKTDRTMLTGTSVRPAGGPPTIGPTWQGFGGRTMSGKVSGAEMIPLDTPTLAALLPLRRNELAMEDARSRAREQASWENAAMERGEIPWALRGLRAASSR